MKSLFAETQTYLYKLFQDTWCDCQIHYGGEEFDSKDLDKWINIFYQPSYGDHTDLCDSTMNYSMLHVACWGSNDLEAMQLSDEVITFVNDNIDKSLYRVRRFEMSDHGWNTSNQVYAVITFTIEVTAR